MDKNNICALYIALQHCDSCCYLFSFKGDRKYCNSIVGTALTIERVIKRRSKELIPSVKGFINIRKQI